MFNNYEYFDHICVQGRRVTKCPRGFANGHDDRHRNFLHRPKILNLSVHWPCVINFINVRVARMEMIIYTKILLLCILSTRGCILNSNYYVCANDVELYVFESFCHTIIMRNYKN